MKSHQIAKNNMYNAMLVFFAKPANAAIWAAFARLVAEIANFVGLKSALDTYIAQQGLDTKGITTGKNADFNAMVEMTVDMASRAFVWAVDTANANLIQLFDIQLDDFDHIAQEVAYGKVQNIRNAINTNIGSLAPFELLPGDVTILDGLMAAYNTSKGTPVDAETDKEVATQSLAEQMHAIDTSLNLISRLLIPKYKLTNADMVKAFKIEKHIHDLPTQHSGVHMHITDADTAEAVEGALFTIPAAGKSAISDISGDADVIKIKAHIYHAFVTAPNYTPRTFKVTILRGKVVSFNVQLSKTAGGGGVSVVREGDIPMAGTVSVDLTGINGNPQTTVTILITLSSGRVFAGNSTLDLPGPIGTFIDFMPGIPATQLADDLASTIGLGPSTTIADSEYRSPGCAL
jgi:hypothetical protein